MKSHHIRSIADFLDVPEAEIGACLKGLREWITAQKALKAALEVQSEPYQMPECYSWRPRATKRESIGSLRPDTPVQDLGLKPTTLMACQELRVLTLEDFSVLEEGDLARRRNVGRRTVTEIREMLRSVGLEFRKPQDEERRIWERAQQVRAGHKAATVTDADHIVELGLSALVRTRLLTRRISTVGQLRRTPLNQLRLIFGKASGPQMLAQLRAYGLDLEPPQSQLELWRSGLITRSQLTRPSDDDAVELLQPWIGSLAAQARSSGVDTVGQLKALALQGEAKPGLRGVGAVRWRLVVAYFRGTPTSTPAASAALEPDALGRDEPKLHNIWRSLAS